ncbi:MAG: hypothetical protein KatS3mg009_0613 [Acidimicrobiia bacterium]|nr:MAG: hypothetical protein KatS3mg009_0613 [Acidimicrobiia bacterium]
MDVQLAVETSEQTTDATTPAPGPDEAGASPAPDPQPAPATEPTDPGATEPVTDATTPTTTAPEPPPPDGAPAVADPVVAPDGDGNGDAGGEPVVDEAVVAAGETAARETDGTTRPAGDAGGANGPAAGILTWSMTPIASPSALPLAASGTPRAARERGGHHPTPHVAGPGQVSPVAVAGRVGFPEAPVRTFWSQIGHAAGTYGPWLALYGIALVVRTVASSAVRDQRNPAPVRARAGRVGVTTR